MYRKSVYYVLGLVLGFVVLVIGQPPSEQAKMVVCDVGQGDAILIIKGSNQVLVDGGPSTEKILSCLEKQIPFWDRRIELIVLTNTDSDHMRGLGAVIERYEVMQFVTSDGVHKSETLDHFVTILTEHKLVPREIGRGDVIKVGGDNSQTNLVFRVLWPPEANAEYVAVLGSQMERDKREQLLLESAKRGNLNERSVVLLLLEDNKQILLTGDAGVQVESELLKLGNLPDIDILKVGHHGSRYASTLEFLETIKPETAVISVGAKNSYGHPTEETLTRLKQVGATIERTDLRGEIIIEL